MKRDIRIDTLRTLGIVLIMLAHVNPPKIIFNIRTFDVPLMSILLGMSFALSSRKRKGNLNYREYVAKRFKRLIIPVWFFITLYLLMYLLGSMLLNEPYPFPPATVFSSYFLVSGISYIWIIRVFFTIAILSPFLLNFTQQFDTMAKKTFILSLALIIQYILCLVTYRLDGVAQHLFEELVSISFGYIILAGIGMWAVKQSKKENLFLSAIAITSFVILGFINGFVPLNDVKYPPAPYFLMYGIAISLLLLVVLSNDKIELFFNNDFILWSSKYSLELYYWHVFPVAFFSAVLPELHFMIKFVIVILSTYFATYIQSKFIPGFFNLDFTVNRLALKN